jgi:hypothetical protein
MVFSFPLFIVGTVAWRSGWAWPELLITLAPVFCVAFIKIGARMAKEKRVRYENMKLGSETLPPRADIAYVTVDGIPISNAKREILLDAMAKAKRASAIGGLVQEIPFQLQDHWGGVWDLQAYEDDQGNRGFSINRVYYSGPSAKIVAECLGIRK